MKKTCVHMILIVKLRACLVFGMKPVNVHKIN